MLDQAVDCSHLPCTSWTATAKPRRAFVLRIRETHAPTSRRKFLLSEIILEYILCVRSPAPFSPTCFLFCLLRCVLCQQLIISQFSIATICSGFWQSDKCDANYENISLKRRNPSNAGWRLHLTLAAPEELIVSVRLTTRRDIILGRGVSSIGWGQAPTPYSCEFMIE